ncbi:MFS transporter [Aestuariimicrobium kwangyangense]|uniref:MFS transporter n=1 Tax=Aestuariimicrobium kwangyangense TaxID=396389 RepID=UPI0003B6D2B8|nr:MFS transporter [Aestuariimicrobium kwangyangense]
MSSIPALEDRRARWAVSLVFFINGASMCMVLPRYPELVRKLDLTNTAFGLAIGLGPIGGLLAGLAAASLMRRFGTARLSVGLQVLASLFHLTIYASQSWLWLMASLMFASACDAITDISMNAHGMRVERRYRRSIMNSYHGWWSMGAVVGGLLGALGAQVGLPLLWQGGIGFLVFASLALFSFRHHLPGHDSSERMVSSPHPASAGEVLSERSSRLPRGMAKAMGVVVALGFVLVFTGSIEDAGNSWGALFMNATFTVTPFVAGLPFIAMQGAQMVGRFLGDPVVDRWGDRMTARVGSLLAIVGMSLALLVPHPVTAVIGFALVGWGIATLFPAAFRAADELEGIPHGLGVTVVGWLARLGFFLSPPLVGWVSDQLTLARALWLVPLYAIGILVLSRVLDTRKERHLNVDSDPFHPVAAS